MTILIMLIAHLVIKKDTDVHYDSYLYISLILFDLFYLFYSTAIWFS